VCSSGAMVVLASSGLAMASHGALVARLAILVWGKGHRSAAFKEALRPPLGQICSTMARARCKGGCKGAAEVIVRWQQVGSVAQRWL
jgi:hypothetical protein